MKKLILAVLILVFAQIFMIGCSKEVSKESEKEIKETIDLVLSYKNGYDDNMKKHISEDNFYICNYVEFYSLYIGELNLEKYESSIKNINKENEKYKVYMVLNMEAKALETHGDEESSDEAIGEDVPVEVVVKEKNGEYYIEGFTEYENLEKAKELNSGFN
ncbi:hypothetical protein [Clostridium sp. C8]|jgi:uncharacterized ParB-like nuclease family protein|uniref:DUF5105 domain-containing protein n=1 Tax=bioreactor metagenome TaxID=1076179 RepID=A0A644WR94_9ZZZZ|nr:hypothetical protein [Clostridium sp. C8]KLE16365.1 hypothetical protein AAT22_05905 [Clostridium sp. C8]